MSPVQKNTAEGDAFSAASSSGSALMPITQRLLSGGLLEVGTSSAPVTLLIFTNFSCSYCREFEEAYVPRLTADFVERGTLRIVTIPFPLKKYPESGESGATVETLAIQKNIAGALGVTLVPTFFINGERIVGLPTYADLRGAIEAALESQTH